LARSASIYSLKNSATPNSKIHVANVEAESLVEAAVRHGGCIPGPHGFDSLIVGYCRGKDMVYAARIRNGFVPTSSRRQAVYRRQYGTRSISGDRLLGLRKYACRYIVMERKSLHSLDDSSRNS